MSYEKRGGVKRLIYAAVGLIATTLGIIGVWLPGMPTTVFVIIGLWAFSNSSPRLQKWLKRIPVLRTAVREAERFQREGTVHRTTKIISQSASWISFVAVTVALQNVTISLIVGLLAVSCTVFMQWVPTAHAVPTEESE